MNDPPNKKNVRRTNKQTLWIDLRWLLIGVFVLFTFLLGCIGFNKYYTAMGESLSYLDIIYRALQLFTLESGFVTGPVSWELEIARWLSPAVAAYTALIALGLIFRDQFQLLRLQFIKNHIVICGSGSEIDIMAEKFITNGYRVVVVKQEETIRTNERLKLDGTFILTGDARDVKLLAKVNTHKARNLILYCESEGVNIEIAVTARKLIRQHKSKTLTCIVHIKDPQLCRLLKEKEIETVNRDSFRLEYFDIFTSGARYWLNKASPFENFKKYSTQPHILIVGLGKMGESLLLQSAKRWNDLFFISKRKLEITVIDRDAIIKTEALQFQHPRLKEICKLNSLEIDIEANEFKRAEFLTDNSSSSYFTNIFICLNDDSFGLTTALLLQKN